MAPAAGDDRPAPQGPWRDLSPDDLLTWAVRDNAGWCALVARTHGCVGRTDEDAWTSPARTPPGYPDAVTLRRGVDPAALLSRVAAGPGCSVKDSYGDLDLSAHGFRELFAATWIAHPDGAPPAPGGDRSWVRVTAAEDLRAWEAGWGHVWPEPLFRPELLRAPEVTVLAAWDGADVAAGAILTRGDAPVVGVSNVFAARDTVTQAWAGILAWAAVHHPGLPLVGYETGAGLAVALDVGFRGLGPLRVWIDPDPDADPDDDAGTRGTGT